MRVRNEVSASTLPSTCRVSSEAFSVCNVTQFGLFRKVGGGYPKVVVGAAPGDDDFRSISRKFVSESLLGGIFWNIFEIFLGRFFGHYRAPSMPFMHHLAVVVEEVFHRHFGVAASPAETSRAQCLMGFRRVGPVRGDLPRSGAIASRVALDGLVRAGEHSLRAAQKNLRPSSNESGDACNLSADQFRCVTSVIRFRES